MERHAIDLLLPPPPSLLPSLPPYLQAGHAQQSVILYRLEDGSQTVMQGLLGQVLVDARQEGQRLDGGGRREGGREGGTGEG